MRDAILELFFKIQALLKSLTHLAIVDEAQGDPSPNTEHAQPSCCSINLQYQSD